MDCKAQEAITKRSCSFPSDTPLVLAIQREGLLEQDGDEPSPACEAACERRREVQHVPVYSRQVLRRFLHVTSTMPLHEGRLLCALPLLRYGNPASRRDGSDPPSRGFSHEARIQNFHILPYTDLLTSRGQRVFTALSRVSSRSRGLLARSKLSSRKAIRRRSEDEDGQHSFAVRASKDVHAPHSSMSCERIWQVMLGSRQEGEKEIILSHLLLPSPSLSIASVY